VAGIPPHQPAGWTGSKGPGLDWKHWPRSSATGLPMMHVITLWLPADFQRQGPQYPGIAFFAGEGQFAPDAVTADATSDDAFLRDLAEAVEHPGLRRRRDIIGGEFALVWLTAEELAPGPTAPRDDLRQDGAWADESEGTNAWDNVEPTTDVWLVPRVDPNTGIAPVETDDEPASNGYTDPFDEDYEFLPWAEALEGLCHLGGTAFPVQAMPEGLTPWYLELEEIAGVNFGGDGNAQIDLESDTFDWACG
jgi:hypothetical protein